MANTLYFGDNLDWLGKLPGGSVDLIYLDPPFNSKRDYNLLYKTPAGHRSEAQVQAFTDTWSWDEHTERQYAELLGIGGTGGPACRVNTELAEMMRAFRGFLREGDVMAYLVMMARRMVEMHRVLKDTGSLYLHCDPTASHYLKILLDAVFGPKAFRNEIVWKRTSARSDSKRFNHIHDVIFFYAKSKDYVWNVQHTEYDQAYLDQFFRLEEEGTGRRFQANNLTGEGTRNGSSGLPWRGIDITAKGKHWKYGIEKLEELDREGRIYWPKMQGGMPRLKYYLDEMKGTALQSVWVDIPPVGGHSNEKLGYPTQKPLALLERIIAASSNPGDVVLDPFCGCGTAVHAAQKLGRRWIGIDITPLAIDLIERRLRDAFPGIKINIEGLPQDYDGAVALAARDKHLFQDWAVTKAGGQPYRGGIKGGDGGIDGLIYFDASEGAGPSARPDAGGAQGRPPSSTKRIVISVKGGGSISPTMVRDLGGLLDGDKTPIGVFISLVEPSKQMVEYAAAQGFYEHKRSATDAAAALYPRLQLLSVRELLDGARPRYPGMQDATHHRARREQRGKQLSLGPG